MNDIAPDAEAIRAAQDEPRWHTTGVGPFVLLTRAWIPRDGGVEEFRCAHRFMTDADREAYRAIAQQSGLRVEVVE